MSYDRIYNFSAGPACLPEEVLKDAQSEILNYQKTGMSVMEMSHRSSTFQDILNDAKTRLRDLLAIPETHDILFLQGGASHQFSMIPLNLYQENKPVDFINTGVWTKKALTETKLLAAVNLVADGQSSGFLSLPDINTMTFSPNASYTYMCSNNTIYGTQFQTFPDTGTTPLVVDMSSDILSRPLNISKFGVIFAGAQKNIGPSGVTIVIIRKNLIRTDLNIPTIFQYAAHSKAGSLYNTPPTYAIYLIGKVLRWLQDSGGVSEIEKKNKEKAALLYQFIDESAFYHCPIETASRSVMNVVFCLKDPNETLEKTLLSEALSHKISGIKGHRSTGGFRASIYNAHPKEGVQALIDFLAEFEKKA